VHLINPVFELTTYSTTIMQSNKIMSRQIDNKLTKAATKKNTLSRMKFGPLKLFHHSSHHSVSSTVTEATEIEKCVSFDDHAAVCYTIARIDYSSEETKATWGTEEEYHKISKQCGKQIDRMDKGEVLKDKKYCARGLEAHTKMGCIVKFKNRAESINNVLREQEKQSNEGTCDDEAIARVYHQTTSSCQMWANVVGLRDHRKVDEYLDDVELQVPRAITHESSTKLKSSIKLLPRLRRTEVTARTA
jgi:hypothetical protein